MEEPLTAIHSVLSALDNIGSGLSMPTQALPSGPALPSLQTGREPPATFQPGDANASSPNVGAIVGGVIGGVVGCVIVAVLVYLCVRRERKREMRTIQRIPETEMEAEPFEIEGALLPPAYNPEWCRTPLEPISVAQLNEKGSRW
ncbi:hypothetical protein CspeluHIS016_0402670 [Cutaneotrichosporon spelunceum]|uniref:receptor protein-tyrosine kinase n=1 Tax=Cutaneotrichosporon spelunceum TaxID=1672016 RepID=A0AAD3TV23_9TREE|nr:hypothetical protein CspeluHIS016_0402670 [Cutaneotrichosporon spelunceum]